MSAARETADGLLREIAQAQARLQARQMEAEAELSRIRERHAPEIARLQEEHAALETELERLVKDHRRELMGGGDRADLPHGSVLLKIVRPVKRVRSMLATLLRLGELAFVKRVESVDWDLIEKQDDDWLAAHGTKRVPKAAFSYELRWPA